MISLFYKEASIKSVFSNKFLLKLCFPLQYYHCENEKKKKKKKKKKCENGNMQMNRLVTRKSNPCKGSACASRDNVWCQHGKMDELESSRDRQKRHSSVKYAFYF